MSPPQRVLSGPPYLNCNYLLNEGRNPVYFVLCRIPGTAEHLAPAGPQIFVQWRDPSVMAEENATQEA